MHTRTVYNMLRLVSFSSLAFWLRLGFFLPIVWFVVVVAVPRQWLVPVLVHYVRIREYYFMMLSRAIKEQERTLSRKTIPYTICHMCAAPTTYCIEQNVYRRLYEFCNMYYFPSTDYFIVITVIITHYSEFGHKSLCLRQFCQQVARVWPKKWTTPMTVAAVFTTVYGMTWLPFPSLQTAIGPMVVFPA